MQSCCVSASSSNLWISGLVQVRLAEQESFKVLKLLQVLCKYHSWLKIMTLLVLPWQYWVSAMQENPRRRRSLLAPGLQEKPRWEPAARTPRAARPPLWSGVCGAACPCRETKYAVERRGPVLYLSIWSSVWGNFVDGDLSPEHFGYATWPQTASQKDSASPAVARISRIILSIADGKAQGQM